MYKVIFILNKPAVPENIGFSMRALKTMGFDTMRIVAGADHHSTQTRKTAYGSHDVLEKAETFLTLKEALAGADLVVGTSAKRRSMRDTPVMVRDLPEFIEEKGKTVQNVAIVFGSEESGLSKEDLSLCDVISSVPLATKYPSLNLAQSVLIYAWELSSLGKRPTAVRKKAPRNKDQNLYKGFLDELDFLLGHLGAKRSPAFHQKVRDRAQFLVEGDIKLMMSVMGKIRRLLTRQKNG